MMIKVQQLLRELLRDQSIAAALFFISLTSIANSVTVFAAFLIL